MTTKPLYELGKLDSYLPVVDGNEIRMTCAIQIARSEILGVDLDAATLAAFHILDFAIGNCSQFNGDAMYHKGMPASAFPTWVAEIAWRKKRLIVEVGQDFSLLAERRYGDHDVHFVAKFLGVSA